MSKKQLIALYICYLIPYVVGNAALPFMPIYAARLGASSSVTGYFLASSFAALAAGTMSAGWFSERFQNRKLIVFIGIIGSSIGSFGMALASNLLLLTLATGFIWFSGGLLTATILILTGLFVNPQERGRTFGILTTALALAAIIGGSYSGRLVELWDYSGLFTFNAAIYVVAIIAAFFLEDKPISKKAKRDKQKRQFKGGQVFWFLFAASILVYTASFATTMILPLMMSGYNFSPSDIASTVAVTGIFNLPLPFVIGWLSDRIGRKKLLLGSYGAGAVGLLFMIYSSLLWHFWASRMVIGIIGTGFALGSALLTDIIDTEDLDRALSWFATTTWIGGVIGYLLTGISIDQFGMINTLWMGLLVAVIAAGLIFAIQEKPGAKLMPINKDV